MARLVNLGSLCVDHVYRVAKLAAAGETLSSASHTVFPGGKGLNQSLAAARAGAAVYHFGCVGADGQLLIDVLKDAGVDTGGIRTLSDEVSGHAVIQVNDAGENAIVIAGAANRLISDEDRAAAFSGLTSEDWLLLQNEINDLPLVLTRAAASPARVAFNVAPVDGREADYDLSAVDLLIVNEIESRALVPPAVAAQDNSQVALALAANHAGMEVVLTAGAGGLIHARDGEAQQINAFEVDPLDETAAGDAFIGYLLAALIAGKEMFESLIRASAAGALAVTVPGAASSIPAAREVEALLSFAEDR